ncbi:MAG: alanine--tRNA ligase [Peptostreptococcaceae bacterium]|nr:alanine--tRNA ligase [Peptostreptococcaceae bacterium]
MKVSEIRKAFLDFFVEHGHYCHESYPLVPINDESLLLINAGMAPLKNYFLGTDTPPSKRMVTCQKCIRTGDIDNVGKTARHATFFEMLGNFSFGDYFKEEAIKWAWIFVTEYLKLDKKDLWVTVYEEDDEALEIWAQKQGVPRDRIVKLGKDDNFWEIGTGTGPSGPCSEIYIDRGNKYLCDDPDCKPGCDCDRFLEFWNLVFTQFNKDINGNYDPLDFPNIDTGMGLERIACIMQGVDSIFDIDTMVKIREEVAKISDVSYGTNEKTDISIRIITDHTRAITFLLSDGVIPSNEGRGYILRRLLRRAARHGKLLGIDTEFLTQVSSVVIREYGDAYPDLKDKEDYIYKLIRIEEKKFQETIDQGLNLLEQQIEELEKNNETMLSGAEAFKLYDTFGFPLEITMEILGEQGKTLDIDEFDKLMETQRETARKARTANEGEGWKKLESDSIPSDISCEFVGYDKMQIPSKPIYIIHEGGSSERLQEGDMATIVLEASPFYGEGGGQVGDKGKLFADGFEASVLDTKKTANGLIIHSIKVLKGSIGLSDEVYAQIEEDRRKDIMKNHSATHLLHKALKMVLGDHVAQAGSYVDDKRLRFDFSHFEALTTEQIERIERIVNDEIFKAHAVTARYMPLNDAKQLGAAAQFDEKYGDIVRVIGMSDFSIELCGGTHVANTIEIMMFKILAESSVASGVRRIEAITGRNVLNYLYEKELKIDRIADILKSNRTSVEARAEQLVKEARASKKEIEKLKLERSTREASKSIDNALDIKGLKVVIESIDDAPIDALRNTAQGIIDKYDDAVVLLGSIHEEKIGYVCAAGKEAVSKGAHAGNVVKNVATISGGGGGGKPTFAQAGGKDVACFEASMEQARSIIETMIK